MAEKHPNFKTGKTIASNGYILVFVGVKHHLANSIGYAYEHRIIAENKIKRLLKKGEQVHHIDGNKKNNSPENLQVVKSFSIHRHLHAKNKTKHPEEKNVYIYCECGCGAEILKYDKVNRPRRFVTGHNMYKK